MLNMNHQIWIVTFHYWEMNVNLNLWFGINSWSESALELKLNLSHILESILVPEPFILEPNSTISSSHILLLDLGIEQNDSETIFQDCSYNQDDYNVRVSHDPIQSWDDKTVNKKEVIKGGFFENSRYLDSAEGLAQSDRHHNHRLEVTFFLPFLLFHAIMH